LVDRIRLRIYGPKAANRFGFDHHLWNRGLYYPPARCSDVLWVGAGTKDTGLSVTRLTFQITHATDSDTNAERDYIVAELRNNRVIEDVNSYRSGQRLPLEPVNHYITDGEVTVARLTPNSVRTTPA
jgi:hypothetical protein